MICCDLPEGARGQQGWTLEVLIPASISFVLSTEEKMFKELMGGVRRRFPAPSPGEAFLAESPQELGSFCLSRSTLGVPPAWSPASGLRTLPAPNFAKILSLSEPGRKLPPLGWPQLARGRDGWAASLSSFLPPAHHRSKLAWKSQLQAAQQRSSHSAWVQALVGPKAGGEWWAPRLPIESGGPGRLGWVSWCSLPRRPSGAPAGRVLGQQGGAASYLKKSFLQ